MMALISPAKKLDFESDVPSFPESTPKFLDQAEPLIKKMRSLSKKKMGELMDLSKDLVDLNAARYENWSAQDHHLGRQAVFAFAGDVYLAMDPYSLSEEALGYLPNHLRILSGLYGILRPEDRILPYRLEMGTQIPVRRRKNLVDYWKDKIAGALNQELEASGENLILNLASKEYFSAIDKKELKADVLNIEFKEEKNGKFKVFGWNAKRARGTMVRFMAENQISQAKDLMKFDLDGYGFNDSLSKDKNWVFTRKS